MWYNIPMPYILSHLAFGHLLLKEHPSFCEEQLPMLALGCMGPDLFFYDRLPPPLFTPHRKKHGNALHGVDCALLMHSLLKHATEETLPYVYGFLTHIALDGTMHPYVEAHHQGLDHTRFEGDLDAIVYREKRDTVPFSEMLRPCSKLSVLDALLVQVSEDCLGCSYPNAYQRSVKKFYRLLPLLTDPTGKKFRALQKVERLFRKQGLLSGFLLCAPREDAADCQNLQHRPWAAPWRPDAVRTESVPELWEEAAERAKILMACVSEPNYAIINKTVSHYTMQKGPLYE